MVIKTNELILSKDLREVLKVIVKDEVDKLPELLEKLEPKERINVICKLIPFVFPKVESVSLTDGEPLQW